MKTQETIFVDSNGQKWVQDHFIYIARCPTSLLHSTSQSVSIPIEADSEFVWVKSSYAVAVDLASNITLNTSPYPNSIHVSITDSGSGRNLQNRPVSITELAGERGLPLVIPIPRVFKPSSNINLTFTNENTIIDFAMVELALIGFKRFKL